MILSSSTSDREAADIDAVCQTLCSSIEQDRFEALKDVSLLSRDDKHAGRLLETAYKMFTLSATAIFDKEKHHTRISGPKVDSLSVLLAAAQHKMPTVAQSQLFWNMIYWGMRLPANNPLERKIATSLFRQGVAYIKEAESSKGEFCSKAMEQWESYFVIVDALADFPTHLVLDIWKNRLPSLLPTEADYNKGTVAQQLRKWTLDLDGTSLRKNAPIPTFQHAIHFDWVSLLLDRAFTHDNSVLKRILLLELFSGTSLAENVGEYKKDEETKDLLLSTEFPTDKNTALNDALERREPYLRTYSSTDTSIITSEKPPVSVHAILRYGKVPPRDFSGDGELDNAVPEEHTVTPEPLPLGLRLPPHYLAGVCTYGGLPKALMATELFQGSAETFGKALGDYFLAYLRFLSRLDLLAFLEAKEDQNIDHVPCILPHFLRTLVSQFPNFAVAKSAYKNVLNTILDFVSKAHSVSRGISPESGPTFREFVNSLMEKEAVSPQNLLHTWVDDLPTAVTLLASRRFSNALDRTSLKCIRESLVYISLNNSRAFSDAAFALSAALLVFTTSANSLPLHDIAHTLSIFPATVLFPIEGSMYKGSFSMASLAVSSDTSSAMIPKVTWDKNSETWKLVSLWLHGFEFTLPGPLSISAHKSTTAVRLVSAVKSYINGKIHIDAIIENETTRIGDLPTPSKSQISVYSATGLARVLTSYTSASFVSHTSEEYSVVFQSILQPMIEVLVCISSQPYLPELARNRSLLLFSAIIAAAFPAGGLGDMHLAATVTGSRIPSDYEHLVPPLRAEFIHVSRCQTSTYFSSQSPSPSEPLDPLSEYFVPSAAKASNAVSIIPAAPSEYLSAPELVPQLDQSPIFISTEHQYNAWCTSPFATTSVAYCSKASGYSPENRAHVLLSNLLVKSGINQELCSFLEVQLNDGLRISTIRKGEFWSPEYWSVRSNANNHEDVSQGQHEKYIPTLNTTFYFQLLSNSIHLFSPLFPLEDNHALQSGQRLLANCMDILTSQEEKERGLHSTDLHICLLQKVHAVHCLAALLNSIGATIVTSGATFLRLSNSNKSEATPGLAWGKLEREAVWIIIRSLREQLLPILTFLLRNEFRKPRLDEPALPLYIPRDDEDKQQGDIDRTGRSTASWTGIRKFYDDCRWTAITDVVRVFERMHILEWQQLHRQLFLGETSNSALELACDEVSSVAGLPLQIAEELTQCTVANVDLCSPSTEPLLCYLSGVIARGALASGESDYVDTSITDLKGIAILPPSGSRSTMQWLLANYVHYASMAGFSTEEIVALTMQDDFSKLPPKFAYKPSSSVYLDDILEALYQVVVPKKTSKRTTVALVSAFVQPALFLRKYIVGSGFTGMDFNSVFRPYHSNGGKQGELYQHLIKLTELLRSDEKPAHCTQFLASRLTFVWAFLTSLGDEAATTSSMIHTREGPTLPVVPILASFCLLTQIPVFLCLLLHREPTLYLDDPLLCDAKSREQMFLWIKNQRNRESNYRSESAYISDAILHAKEFDPMELNTQYNVTSGHNTVSFFAEFDEDGKYILQRGSGSVTRIQMLVWLEELGRRASIARNLSSLRPGGVLKQMEDLRLEPVSISLQRTVLIRLLRLNLLPEWSREVNPGRVDHLLRLRTWQALVIACRDWAKGDSITFSEKEIFDTNQGHDLRLFRNDVVDKEFLSRLDNDVKALLTLPKVPKFMRNGKNGALPNGSDVQLATVDLVKLDEATNLIPYSDAAMAMAVLRMLFSVQLMNPQLPSVRHYMELTASILSRRFPQLSHDLILAPLLRAGFQRTQVSFSLSLVTADLAHHLAKLTQFLPRKEKKLLKHLSISLMRCTLPFITSPNGLIRVVSQTSLLQTFPLLFGDIESLRKRQAAKYNSLLSIRTEDDTSTDGDYGDCIDWILPIIETLITSEDVNTMMGKQIRHFVRVNPELSATLEVILSSPVTDHGEIVPVDAVSAIRTCFQAFMAEYVEKDSMLNDGDPELDSIALAIRAGILPASAEFNHKLREGFGVFRGAGVYEMKVSLNDEKKCACDSNLAPEGRKSTPFNYQRKVLSATKDTEDNRNKTDAAYGQSNSSEDGGVEQSSEFSKLDPILSALADVVFSSSSKPTGSHATTLANWNRANPILNCVDEQGRPHQPLIICASLVNKAPNLGGLARTAEIFGAQSLVVPDLRIRENTVFRDTSVTASEWLPLDEVRPEELVPYLRAMRAKGWSVVILEQASRSVQLGSPSCVLPEKCLLLLGAEKEGVPVEAIAEADVVVEIPQLGLIRSLNVHVSGSMLIWEYTRQRMLRLKN